MRATRWSWCGPTARRWPSRPHPARSVSPSAASDGSGFPEPPVGFAGLVQQRRPDAFDRVRRCGEHIAARELGVALFGPFATEHAQAHRVDAEHHAPDVAPEDRAGAHHARLARRVQRGARQRLAVHHRAELAHRVGLGVAGAVARFAGVAPGLGEHAAVVGHHHRTEGPVAALACHARVAVASAKVGLPEVKIGILPGAGGTQRLPRFVGKSKAMDLVLTGRMMDAAEAERCGLVSRVVPLAELM